MAPAAVTIRPRPPLVLILTLALALLTHPQPQRMSADGLSTSAAVSPSRRTFYRRPLPEGCTALSSPAGRATFSSALAGNGLKSFFPLIEQFSTQADPAFCGPTTLVVVLNALSVDPRRTWKGPWRWYEESFLNCCIDLEEVKKTGITFGQFVCLAKCQGLTVEAHLGSESSIHDFRSAVKRACLAEDSVEGPYSSNEENHTFLVVSYCRKIVGQTGCGHFSPVAAYDEASDSVLILDTARFKYGPHWVPLQVIFDALQPLDPATGKSRGYVLLSYDGDDQDSLNLPRSILFRSNKAQDPARRRFKAFLSERRSQHNPATFEDVIEFWTKTGEDIDYVWQILEPQLVPVDDEETKMVEDARALLRRKIDSMAVTHDERLNVPKVDCQDDCEGRNSLNPPVSRKMSIRPIEAIFVVFLSSLEPEIRRELVFEDRSNGDATANITREQIICEAELIQYAIDASDEDELTAQ